MGHGARGLQPRRHRVGVPAARSRAVARVPLGRGRARRLLRRRAAAVPRPRAVERPRPDPEGADLRPHRQPGQPRRGREGVLVVPRRAAEPRVEPLALPLSAARVPLRRPRRRERAPRQARSGVRAARHRRLRRGPLLDRRGRLREGRSARHPDDGPRHERGAGGGHDPRAPDGVVPQHVGLGARRREAAAPRGRRVSRRHRPSVPRPARARRRADGPERAEAPLLRQRDELGQAVRHRVRQPDAEGRDQRPRRRRRRHRRRRVRDEDRVLVRGTRRPG